MLQEVLEPFLPLPPRLFLCTPSAVGWKGTASPASPQLPAAEGSARGPVGEHGGGALGWQPEAQPCPLVLGGPGPGVEDAVPFPGCPSFSPPSFPLKLDISLS